MRNRIDYRKGGYHGLALIVLLAALLWEAGVADAVFANTPISPQKTAADASAEAVMQDVRSCVRQGDFRQALSLLTPYSTQPEAFPTLYSDYLVILTWAGRSAEAIERFEALPRSFPRRPYLLRNLAKAYYDRGDFTHAAALYQETCAQDSDDLTALEGWLASLVAGGHYDEAKRALEKTAGLTAESRRLDLLKAQVLLDQERFAQALGVYDTLMAAQPAQSALIAKTRDDLIAGLSADRQARLLAALKTDAESSPSDTPAAQYYALCLVLTHRHQTAVEYLDSIPLDASAVPSDRLYWFSWANFKAGRPQHAMQGFNTLLARDPHHLRARIGRVYCFAAQADYARALNEIEALQAAFPQDAELFYAQAHVFEKQGRFWDAMRIYDRILEGTPDDRTAVRFRLRALADMGATSVAARMAGRMLSTDEPLRQTFRQDAARDCIHWEEYLQAVQLLATQAGGGDRYAFDYIVALNKAGQYGQAFEFYERLIAAGVTPPYWVRLAAADAYLAEQHPEEALSLYNLVLAEQPALWEGRLGKFYALQTLRRWEEADAWLDFMDAEIPIAARSKPNPAKFELSVVRAWYLAHQNRLGEAESAFGALQAEAPANLDVRNGLAHIYLWRGRPRQSLQAFNIIDTLAPSYEPAQSGRAMALNHLAEKAQARTVVAGMLDRKPYDKNAQQTQRTLKIDQMKESRTEIQAQREDDESYDTRIRTQISAPLNLKTRLTGFLLWRRTWQDDASSGTESAYFRRFGIGLDHLVNADWRVRPALSVNYDNGKEPGASLRIDYTPTDHWAFGVHGDSFSTNVAGRARAAGIEAELFGADAVWRPSEWRQAGMGYTRSLFSDDNVRDEFFLGYEQNVWVKHDWRMRVFLDLYTTWNSKGDQTDYFNPEQAWALSLTHMTEQTIWHLYQRSFVHRLYISAGTYHQKGYGNDLIGSLRYEQAHAFSDCHLLQAGIGFGRNIYDGEAVSDIRLDVVYQWRF